MIKSHEEALKGKPSSFELLYQGRIFKAYVEPLADENEDIVGVIGVANDITEQKALEEKHAERVKELEFLSLLSELYIRHGLDAYRFIEESLTVIPGAFYCPEATSVRISFREREFASVDFVESSVSMVKEISVYGEDYGTIEVFVDPEKTTEGTLSFLEDERRLLDIIAERIGSMLERKIENDSLSRKSIHLQAIIDSARDSIALLNDRGEYVDVNPENRRLTGYTKQEIQGVPVADLLVGELKKNFDTIWNEFMDKGTLSGETELKRKDGAIITIEFHAVANILSGLHLSINRDITERKAYEKQLEKNIRERDVLLQEIHHRVKNNLQVIISMFHLQLNQIGDSAARNFLEDAQNRIQTIALVYEQIHATGNLVAVDMSDYLGGLVSALKTNENGGNLTLLRDLEPLEFPIDSAVPCGLIVNELVTNSIKHAFPGNGTGTVRVELRRKQGDTVELVVQDNGAGFPKGFDFFGFSSLGLSLINSLAEQLEGEVNYFNDDGAAVHVLFPLPVNP